MYETYATFRDAIRAVGLEPPNAIEPGKLHRFPGVGKGRSNRAAWCVLFDDGFGGCYGDWSSGFSETWQAKRTRAYSHAERAAFTRGVKAARAKAECERRARQIAAANRAVTIWSKAVPSPENHPYLLRKRIRPHGARLHKNAVTLPVMDISGELNSLQFIGSDGTKLLLSGGRKRGCFIPVAGNLESAGRVVVCEGWATGCTLAEDDTNAAVVAAIDAGNLRPVALATRDRLPSAELVIAGDDDRATADNPGATKARAAAVAADALLALPQWPGGAPANLSDFNDLAAWLAGGGA